MDEYKDIRNILAPRQEIKASGELRERIEGTLERHTRKWYRMPAFYGISSACAVAVVMCILFMPVGMSAQRLLASALDAMKGWQSLEMEVEVRTQPMENFAFIDLEAPFVEHKINVERNDTLTRWRVDKGGRVSYGTASESYTWMPEFKIGWHNKSGGGAVLDFISIFLSPDRIIDTELELAMAGDGTEYKVKRTGKDIQLTVHSFPNGDFTNPYMLNRSVAESENIRRYTFDADTKALKTASVEVVDKGRFVEVLRLKAIRYGAVTKDIAMLPGNVKFVEADEEYAERGGFASLSAQEVVTVVLSAFEKWDNDIIGQVMDRSSSDVLYKDDYKGARLVSVGEPFRSGNKGYIYVPCRMRMPDGDTRQFNVVLLRKPDRNWLIVGGL